MSTYSLSDYWRDVTAANAAAVTAASEHTVTDAGACPVCQDGSEIIEVDQDTREHATEFAPATAELRAGFVVNQGQTEYATIAYACNKCERFLTIPEHIAVDWS